MNMNNELSYTSHRNSVIGMFLELNKVSCDMQAMLDLPFWYVDEERMYDKLKDKRHAIVSRLKMSGMFL